MTRVDLLDELADLIVAVERPHPIRVAIDGVDAAGKTTLADELVPCVEARGRPVIRAGVDSFHHPHAHRYRRGPDSPEGYFYDSFDYAAVKSSMLEPLGPGGDLYYQVAHFDYRTDAPVVSPRQRAAPDSILLFDGIFLMRPELAGCWDFRIFVNVTFETSLQRNLGRDVVEGDEVAREQYARRYAQRYRPGQTLYLASCRPTEQADAVVDNNDLRDPTLKMRTG